MFVLFYIILIGYIEIKKTSILVLLKFKWLFFL